MTNEDFNLWQMARELFMTTSEVVRMSKAALAGMPNTDLAPDKIAKRQELNRIIEQESKRLEIYKAIKNGIEEKYFKPIE